MTGEQALELARRFAASTQAHVPGLDRDDLVQELALAVWRAAGGYDRTRGTPIEAYSWGVCRRRLVDLLRVHGSHNRGHRKPAILSSVGLDVDMPQPIGTEQAAHGRLDLRELLRLAPTLPRREREGIAYGLRDLDLPRNRAAQHGYWRAKQRLRATLGWAAT